jgi:hypothetical protein
MDLILIESLKQFDPISLDEMDNVKLLNRVDTKYIFCPNNVNELIESLQSSYRILEIKNNRLNHYQTLYFDTQNFQLYLDHHNDRVNRYKLRFRKYLDSNLCYLEIKFKNAKDRTDKRRTKKNEVEFQLSEPSVQYLQKHLKTSVPEFSPVLWNSFTRLTFVHKSRPERLTIDSGLEFKCYKSGNKIKLPGIIIAELKRDKASEYSDFAQIMRSSGLHQMSFSKYCMGVLLMNKELKYNRFKPQLLTLKKLTNGTVYPLAA